MRGQTKKYELDMKPVARKEAMVIGDKYRFTILTDCLIRMEYQEEGLFVDEPTQTVICREFPVPEYRVIEKENFLEIVTDKLHLYYDKKPFSKEGLSIQLKEGFHVYGSIWSYGDTINDLKGTARTLDGADGAVELESGLLSREGFTLLDDSEIAFITEEQWVAAKNRASIDLYFFGYGHDYLECLRDFYHLSGSTPLLPRFTMGNWWSRYYQYTEESYLKLMEQFREKNIPLSTAVIDMDWHLVDIPRKYGSGWTGYTWNKELFPDPKRFMDKLHEKGMHVTLNVHPADGVRAHEDAYLPMAKELGIDYENEDKIPFDSTNRKFMEAYFKYLHHPNEEDGVDFWWLDWQQGSKSGIAGIDTLWMLNHLHFLDSGREGKTPLTFSRYAGIGSHRYPIGFSGDTVTTWESLDFQPYFTANASNAGYSWWSHDIGGHQQGVRDDEMAVRWLQFGVFSPIMRMHSTKNEFYGKEPWNFNALAEGVMTRFLQLRHKLIPYLYTMNYRTHRDGLPIVQPMYYHHDTEEAYQVPNQYYFGTEMIVCPITRPMDKRMMLAEFDAWIPEGNYIDFFTGQVYTGGRRMVLYRNLDSIPVLVPAGGIIPMAKDYLDCHMQNPKELEVHIFNGADGAFALYEDSCDEGRMVEPVITHFTFHAGKRAEVAVSIEGEMDGIIPEERKYEIHIKAIGQPTEVAFTGNESGEFVWHYDSAKKEIVVSFYGGKAKEFRIQMQTDSERIEGPEKEKAIYDILHRAQIEYNLKATVFEEVCREKNAAKLFAKLQQMKLENMLTGAIVEQMIADCQE